MGSESSNLSGAILCGAGYFISNIMSIKVGGMGGIETSVSLARSVGSFIGYLSGRDKNPARREF